MVFALMILKVSHLLFGHVYQVLRLKVVQVIWVSKVLSLILPSQPQALSPIHALDHQQEW
jgi:hypothetical protein